MIPLTLFQQYDLVRMLAEKAGGRFEFLNREIPAFQKTPGSEWVKIENSAELDILSISKRLNVKILDLPTSNDDHGGAGLIKDRIMLHRSIKDFVLENDVKLMEPQQNARVFSEYLKSLEATTPLKGFEESLIGIFNKSYFPKRVVEEIDFSAQKVIWLSNHKRAGYKNKPEVTSNGFVDRITDKSLLLDILKDSARNYYESPIEFAMSVYGKLNNMNIALSLPGMGGLVGDKDLVIKNMIEYALPLYKKNGEKAFVSTVDSLELQYQQIDKDTRRIGKENGLALIRDIIQKGKQKLDVVDDKKTVKPPILYTRYFGEMPGNEELLKQASKRSHLHKWKLAIDTLVSEDNSVPRGKIIEKWCHLTKKISPANSTSEQLSLVVEQVEKVYGNLLDRVSKDKLFRLKAKVGMFLSDSKIPKIKLLDLIDDVIEFEDDTATSFFMSNALNEKLDDKLLIAINEDYKKAPFELDVRKLLGEVKFEADSMAERSVAVNIDFEPKPKP